MEQHTYYIETTAGATYLVIWEDEDIEDVYARFQEDEAGQDFKDAKLISYERIN